MCVARAPDGGPRYQRGPSDAELFIASGVFEAPTEMGHAQPVVLPAEVVGVRKRGRPRSAGRLTSGGAFTDELRSPRISASPERSRECIAPVRGIE
jgi:hypothetical protein